VTEKNTLLKHCGNAASRFASLSVWQASTPVELCPTEAPGEHLMGVARPRRGATEEKHDALVKSHGSWVGIVPTSDETTALVKKV
jgi:hypothetical protein